MKQKEKTEEEQKTSFENKKVLVKTKDHLYYTIQVTKQTDYYLMGIDKFNEPIMINFDNINSITMSGNSNPKL